MIVPSKQAMKKVTRIMEKMTQKRATEMPFRYGWRGTDGGESRRGDDAEGERDREREGWLRVVVL
jgi:hypothetical protein